MATNNPTNGPGNRYSGSVHPTDLLEAFALNALDLAEEERVQDHLDNCDLCSSEVSKFQEAASSLVQAVDLHNPPPELRARLMQAVSRVEPAPPTDPAPYLVAPLGDRLFDSRLVRVLVPLATSVAMVLVVLAVAMNVRISSQFDDLQSENSSLLALLDSNMATTTAQMNAAADAESNVMDLVLRLQKASYELAQPDNMSLELRSPFEGSRSQGVLLVNSDGNRGVIMVAGLEPPTPSTSYHIWFMRGQDKLWAGQVDVDSDGWGTVLLQVSEPIMGFEKVELTSGSSQVQSDMVLQGSLVAMSAPRLVTYSAWR
ncbi:MAG: anti-sigma factor [Chloroflexi bacterium]|nr:anti-sigma factor [Chloroflexota bacterium]